MIRQPRQKNDRHLDFVRSLSCVVCLDNTATEAAHVRYADRKAGKRPVGTGEKPDDRWTVPLCGDHHRDQHKHNEREWWLSQGINPIMVSLALYGASGNHDLAEEIVREHSEAAIETALRNTTAWSG